jgi:Lysozyme like domain
MGSKVMLLVQRVTVSTEPGAINLGPDARVLTADEMRGLCTIYFPASEVDHALAVSQCESGWNTGAWATSGEDSRGLFQINVGPGAHPELAQYNLFDAQINAYFAGQIFKSSGWGPWTCAHRLGIV